MGLVFSTIYNMAGMGFQVILMKYTIPIAIRESGLQTFENHKTRMH